MCMRKHIRVTLSPFETLFEALPFLRDVPAHSYPPPASKPLHNLQAGDWVVVSGSSDWNIGDAGQDHSRSSPVLHPQLGRSRKEPHGYRPVIVRRFLNSKQQLPTSWTPTQRELLKAKLSTLLQHTHTCETALSSTVIGVSQGPPWLLQWVTLPTYMFLKEHIHEQLRSCSCWKTRIESLAHHLCPSVDGV